MLILEFCWFCTFLESNSPDIFALCETNLDDSIDSGNFFVRGYLPLIQKDSSTHMHGLRLYTKEGLHFAWDLSLENSADTYVFSWLYFTQSLTFFSCIDHLLHLCNVFYSISSNVDEVLLINPSANMFVFGELTSIIRTGLPILVELRSGELCYNFAISNHLTQMVNFPTWMPDCDSHNPALLDFFFLVLVFVLQWLSLHLEILIMLLSQFPVTFYHIHNEMPASLRCLWLFSCWLGFSLQLFETQSMGGYL